MKYAAARPYADPEKAARRILEIATAVEPVQGRIHIEKITADHVSSIGVHECALLTAAIAARPLCSAENAGATKRVQRSVWYPAKKRPWREL
jgi:hypothetical protein